jgi:hypothetical protein
VLKMEHASHRRNIKLAEMVQKHALWQEPRKVRFLGAGNLCNLIISEPADSTKHTVQY